MLSIAFRDTCVTLTGFEAHHIQSDTCRHRSIHIPLQIPPALSEPATDLSPAVRQEDLVGAALVALVDGVQVSGLLVIYGVRELEVLDGREVDLLRVVLAVVAGDLAPGVREIGQRSASSLCWALIGASFKRNSLNRLMLV